MPWRPRGSRSTLHGAATYAKARLPPGSTPWRAASWAVLDLELTGLDPRRDEIVSFGVIPIEGGRVRPAAGLSALVAPERELAEASIVIHGIRAADLDRAPSLTDSLVALLPVLAGRPLIAHHADIERAFLGRALQQHGLRLRGSIVDTEVLGRLWLAQRDRRLRSRLSLSELAGELGLPAERPHDAFGDALTTAQIFIALASHLDANGDETVASLSRAGRRLDAFRLFHTG
jgi:DNA polymerase-3 subunit epsilon